MPIDWETQPISIKSTVKIKGDAGEYKVWGVDWENNTLYIARACGMEWVSFDKIQWIKTPERSATKWINSAR